MAQCGSDCVGAGHAGRGGGGGAYRGGGGGVHFGGGGGGRMGGGGGHFGGGGGGVHVPVGRTLGIVGPRPGILPGILSPMRHQPYAYPYARMHGPGYFGGIVRPWHYPYMPLLPLVRYTIGFCSVCGLPSVYRCPTCGLPFCQAHAMTHDHMFGMPQTLAEAADVVGIECDGEECEDDCGVVGMRIGSSDAQCCFSCGSNGPLSKCGTCHTVLYCSPECQRHHWRSWHHKKCAKLAGMHL